MLGTARSALAALLVALSLAGVSGGCTTGCPGALLEGVLTRRGDELVVEHSEFTERIDWAQSHHRVRDDGGTLVVVDWLGIVRAREGEFVRLGGGEVETGVWGVCGLFEVASPPP